MVAVDSHASFQYRPAKMDPKRKRCVPGKHAQTAAQLKKIPAITPFVGFVLFAVILHLLE